MKKAIIIKKFKIVIDINNIMVYDKGNSLDTPIHLKVNNYVFPDLIWTDLTYSILPMWSENIISLSKNNKCNTLLYFMDGDYSIQIKRLDRHALISLISKKKEVYRFITTIDEIVASLIDALNQLEKGLNFIAFNNIRKKLILNTIQYYIVILKMIYNRLYNTSNKKGKKAEVH